MGPKANGRLHQDQNPVLLTPSPMSSHVLEENEES